MGETTKSTEQMAVKGTQHHINNKSTSSQDKKSEEQNTSIENTVSAYNLDNLGNK